MSAADMVRQWQQAVKANLLPALHAHQAKALGLLSWTMALAGDCRAGAIASLAPAGKARPASVRRRIPPVYAGGWSGCWPTSGSTPWRRCCT